MELLSTRMGTGIPVLRCTLFLLCVGLTLSEVSMPVVHAQDDMPTAEEMQEMQEAMRAAQDLMKNLDPETRKQLDQMMASPSAGSGAADDSQPVRDTNKLAAVSTKALGDSELKGYLESLQQKLAAAITAKARERAELINTEMKKAGDYLPGLRAAANGMAAWGALPEAAWLMGKVALASGSAQDMNNLAAFLSMLHAESAVLPILYTLNARYPNNSTVLNNLGQARYGLGDITGAEKFLLAAIQKTPLHPQANVTIARIQMARGDLQAAQASLHKALQGGFSNAKEEQLRKAGGQLNKDDVRWRRPMPPDPLGLERFVIPPYPMKAAELPQATREWHAFKRMTADLVSSLGQQQQQISDGMSQKALMNAAIGTAFSPYILKASTLMGSIAEKYEIALTRQSEAIVNAMQASANASLALNKRIEAIDEEGEEKYRYVAGGYGYEYTCGEVAAEIDAYLSTSNRVFSELQTDMLAAQRRYLNETSFLSQYTSPGPEMFETSKLSAKASFAQAMNSLNVALYEGMEARAVCFKQPAANKGGGNLAKFDDIHCEFISSLDIPGVGSIVSRCNVTEANLAPIFAPFKAGWTVEISDNNTNLLTRASAEVTIEGVTVGGYSEFDADGMKSGGMNVGVTKDLLPDGRKLSAGPLEIGAKVGVTAGFEFDRGGITDVSITAGVDTKTSSTIGDTGMAKSEAAVKAGVNSSWSWNSGFGGGSTAGFDSSVF